MTSAATPVDTVCLSCKQREAAQLQGSEYSADGENGMRIRFWLCNPCAITAAPATQGPMTMPASIRG